MSLENMSFINKDTIYPTSLFNSIRDDNIIDYIKYHDITNNIVNKFSLEKLGFNYLMEDGQEFEKNIIECIKQLMINNNEIDLFYKIEYDNLEKNDHILLTNKIILQKKYDIILGAQLYNCDDNTAGYPDLIVSDKWLSKYINEKFDLNQKNIKIYYIIDIKATSITLINNGKNISNKYDYNTYKSQVLIYKNALDKLQNYKTNYGFIMGKKYNSNDKIYETPFDTLGIIDYNYEKSINKNFYEINKNAINQNKEVKSLNDERSKRLFKRNALNNMKNKYANKYKKFKQNIADENKELSRIAYVGNKEKLKANSWGINKYTDKRLSSLKMGIKGKKGVFVDKILKFVNNKNSKNLEIPFENNILNWRVKKNNEFYIDFETYDIKTFEKTQKIVYMIGVGYVNINNLWEYKCFYIDYSYTNNGIKNEKELVKNFLEFIFSFKKPKESLKKYLDNTRLYHYSHAEPVEYNKLLDKIGDFQDIKINRYKDKLPWFDVHRVLKGDFLNPILVKECFGNYGLKVVCNALYKLGYIDLKWPDLDCGMTSMFIARDEIYNINKNINHANNQMKRIIEYNEIDCKSVYKLLECIRNY
jgi:hypothetical protein